MLTLILKIAALVCWGLAAFGVGGKINLVALGLALWFLPEIVPL